MAALGKCHCFAASAVCFGAHPVGWTEHKQKVVLTQCILSVCNLGNNGNAHHIPVKHRVPLPRRSYRVPCWATPSHTVRRRLQLSGLPGRIGSGDQRERGRSKGGTILYIL